MHGPLVRVSRAGLGFVRCEEEEVVVVEKWASSE